MLLGGLDFWAHFVFPNVPSSRSLMFWTGMLAVVSVFDFVAASTLLSYRRVILCNLFEFFNSSIWLLCGLWWWQQQSTVVNLTRLQTILVLIMAGLIIALVILPKMSILKSFSKERYTSVLKESIGYSLPRSITPFLDILVFLIGPWLLRSTPEKAGFLIIAFFSYDSGVYSYFLSVGCPVFLLQN